MDDQRTQVKARLRATYGALYDRLIQILYLADIATISYVARDEYEPEVTTILPRLPEATRVADVERILQKEFARWFGPYPSILTAVPERYVWAARTIWQAWCVQRVAAQRSAFRNGLAALWWAVKYRCFTLVYPVQKPRVHIRL